MISDSQLNSRFTPFEHLVYRKLLENIDRLVTYEEFKEIGVPFTSGRFNLANAISGIRRKLPEAPIFCVSKHGYIYQRGLTAEGETLRRKVNKVRGNTVFSSGVQS